MTLLKVGLWNAESARSCLLTVTRKAIAENAKFMNTFYARHTWRMDISEATRESIFAQGRIAVHHPHHRDGSLRDKDLRSTNPDDHNASGRKALRALNSLAIDGGYVLAEYHAKAEVLIGYVAPGTEIKFFEGQWGDLYKLSGRTAVLKTLQMNPVKKIFAADATALLAARPRQGTLMKWPRVKTMVHNLVEGVTEPQSLADLSPAQQEIMCSEFLRQPESRYRRVTGDSKLTIAGGQHTSRHRHLRTNVRRHEDRCASHLFEV